MQKHIEFAHLVHQYTPKTQSPATWMEERKHIVLHEKVHYHHGTQDIMGYETHHLHVDEFVKRFPQSLDPDTFSHENIHERMLLEAQERGDELMIVALTRWKEQGVDLTAIAKQHFEGADQA